MNPKQFLQIGGVILVLVGVLGFFLLGPTSDQSIFGSTWWFDNVENWAHLVLGVVALLAAYVLPGSSQKSLAIVVGIIGIIVGLWSISGSQTVLAGATLENPMDTILHLVVGAWALWAGMRKE